MDDIREKLETAIRAMKRVRGHYEREGHSQSDLDMAININSGLTPLRRALLVVRNDADTAE